MPLSISLVASILTQTIESLDLLAQYCSEFLIHAADVEGLCNGIDQELVKCKIRKIDFVLV